MRDLIADAAQALAELLAGPPAAALLLVVFAAAGVAWHAGHALVGAVAR